MTHVRRTIPLLALWLAACSPVGALTPTSTAASRATPLPTFSVPPSATPLGPTARIILRYSSMSFIVEDPRKVLATLEELVVEAGGFVTSASSYSSSESIAYANLSARVPPDKLPALRRAVLDLAIQVQNDSMSSQDITNQYRSLLESQAELARARENLHRLLSEAGDPSATESLILLHDLLKQQMESVESQLQSYQESAALSSFDISLTQMALLPPPNE